MGILKGGCNSGVPIGEVLLDRANSCPRARVGADGWARQRPRVGVPVVVVMVVVVMVVAVSVVREWSLHLRWRWQ